jgi:PPM family protein phosphatase
VGEKPQTCPACGTVLRVAARFCSQCGTAIANEHGEPDEIFLAGSNRLRVSQDTLDLRELLAIVKSGVTWWEQRLHTADDVAREQAAAAIKDLSQVFESLSQQLEQGRKTVRITTRLPTIRLSSTGCPVCGRGNRAGARYCWSCGASLPDGKQGPGDPPPVRARVAVASETGMVREHNEDSCFAGALYRQPDSQRDATLLLVADGMGGARAGEEASRLASETIQTTLKQRLAAQWPDTLEQWHSLLRGAGGAANQHIHSRSQTNVDQHGMGTTMTMIVLADNYAHLGHVGDSRAYLMNAAGVTDEGDSFMQLSSDHTLVARLVDIGQLTPEEARNQPQRNILYRALGTDATVEVDTSSQIVTTGDVLLLCSDGLTNHVEDAELAQIALHAASPDDACRKLVALANQRGGRDNISVVVARIE